MRCTSVEINIQGVQNNYFIDQKDVRTIILQINGGKLEGVPVKQFDLGRMEAALKKNIWIKKAELFFDNNEHLKVEVLEREPVARIFTDQGNSFYIDSSFHVLPLSDKFSARLPVFTGFVETSRLSKSDSLLLRDIGKLADYILNDPFWMAQVEQVEIQPGRQFELIPKVGNQVIVFGDISDYHHKFNNLLTFYREILSKSGWNKYSRINVQYQGQVIGVRRGAEDKTADSLRTTNMMQAIVLNAQSQANDSLSNIQLIPEEQAGIVVIQTAERDEISIGETVEKIAIPVTTNKIDSSLKNSVPATPIVTKSLKPAVIVNPKKIDEKIKQAAVTKKIIKPAAKKPIIKKAVIKKAMPANEKPKAVMPPKNDY